MELFVLTLRAPGVGLGSGGITSIHIVYAEGSAPSIPKDYYFHPPGSVNTSGTARDTYINTYIHKYIHALGMGWPR